MCLVAADFTLLDPCLADSLRLACLAVVLRNNCGKITKSMCMHELCDCQRGGDGCLFWVVLVPEHFGSVPLNFRPGNLGNCRARHNNERGKAFESDLTSNNVVVCSKIGRVGTRAAEPGTTSVMQRVAVVATAALAAHK